MKLLLLALSIVLLSGSSVIAADWLGASQSAIRQEFKDRLPQAPIFGDADDGDLFTDGDYVTTFGYKKTVVVYVLRKKKTGGTLSEAELLQQLDRSRSGGQWIVKDTDNAPAHNPNRSYAHQKSVGEHWENTGEFGKEQGQRKRLITFSSAWSGDPNKATMNPLWELDFKNLQMMLKEKGFRIRSSK